MSFPNRPNCNGKLCFICSGLTMQATVYYKLLISWTSQKVKDTCVTRNTFDFKHGTVLTGLAYCLYRFFNLTLLSMHSFAKY